MKLSERIFKRKAKLTSPYGYRIHPVTKVKSFHYGCDYGTNLEKWNQYALESGKVIACGVDTAQGQNNALFAWVEYPRLGIKVLHYHLDKVMVKKNQLVDENTIIGTTGSTGNSTAIHLHLGVKYLSTNQYFDPESYDYVENIKLDAKDIIVGDKVKIVGTHYATGQVIPQSQKLKTFTVSKVSNGKVLLKEIVSWVWIKDVIEV